MHSLKNTKQVTDGKTWIGYLFWNMVDRLVIAHHFQRVQFEGLENIPTSGPFLMIANHSSRWDGPIVQYLLNRRSNYMVAPKEMIGLQGAAVMSVGSFPANPRLNPVGFALQQLLRGEPVVVFPEGNVFYDGIIHPFKLGVARIALSSAKNGHPVPVIPMYIAYDNEKMPSVKVIVGKPIAIEEELKNSDSREAQSQLTRRMYEEVVSLKEGKRPVETTCHHSDTEYEDLRESA